MENLLMTSPTSRALPTALVDCQRHDGILHSVDRNNAVRRVRQKHGLIPVVSLFTLSLSARRAAGCVLPGCLSHSILETSPFAAQSRRFLKDQRFPVTGAQSTLHISSEMQ